jgi:hypothetical protein
MGQAGRGQAEHWLQRVRDGQAFEFIGTQVAEGWNVAAGDFSKNLQP